MPRTGPMTTASKGTTGAMGPSLGTRKRAPTHREIIRAKSQAVGGIRKRCKRGKNCSAACIQSRMVCLVEFPLPVQEQIKKVPNYLMEYLKAKNNLQPGSIQEKRLAAAVKSLSSVIDVEEGAPLKRGGPAKPKTSWKGSPEAQSTTLSYEEIQGLKQRRDLLGQVEFDDEVKRTLWKDAMTRGIRLTRAELEMLYDALPKDIQTSLQSTGRPGQGAWYGGKDENGNVIFVKGRNKERGIMILDVYLRQGGTSAYDPKGGKVWALSDLQVEHVRPLTKGGEDKPSNIVLVRAGTNEARQSQSLGKFIDGLPSNRKEYDTYVASKDKGTRIKQAKRAREDLVDPKSLSDREIFDQSAKGLAGIFRSENGGQTPGTFTKEWLGVSTSAEGGRKGNSGPPVPFAKGLGLIAKTEGLAKARSVGITMKKVWNDEWKTDGKITKQQAYQQMLSEMQKNLTPEQYNGLFLPAAQAWAKSNGFL